MWNKIRSAASFMGSRLTGSKTGAQAASRYHFYDIGFHGDRYLLQLVDAILAAPGNFFVETGTNVGSTLAYVARKYPEVGCLSCEPDGEAFQHALANTAGLRNVRLFNVPSQEFLRILAREQSHLFAEDVLFWLDAHGYGFQWPLKEEVAFITTNFAAAWMLIDDFKVPGLDVFGYDEYEGQVCSFDFIRDALNLTLPYRLFYPRYTEKSSQHHPLRGWGLLEFGHGDWVLPEGLRDKVQRIEVDEG